MRGQGLSPLWLRPFDSRGERPAGPTIATTSGKAFTDGTDLSMLNDQRTTTLRPDRVGVVDQASRPCNANSPELVGAGSAGHSEYEVSTPPMNMFCASPTNRLPVLVPAENRSGSARRARTSTGITLREPKAAL